jgi:multiple sugar transport system substrate-binding protein
MVEGPRAPWGLYYRAGQYISMLSSSTSKDLSARFINFFVNDLEANRILLAERGIPIPTDVREDLAGRVDANMKYLFDYISRITPFTSPANPPYPAAAGESQDMIRPIVLQALNGRITPDAAMTQMVQAANAVLGR